jgi:hypothetical protein
MNFLRIPLVLPRFAGSDYFKERFEGLMGWNPFADKTFLDPGDEEWVIETWRWFLTQFGGADRLRETLLVLPTPEFFPPTDCEGHERALHIFMCVKRLAKMSEWECELVSQPHRAELRVSNTVALKPIKSSPAGTFRIDRNGAAISYDPSDLKQPVALIATFAHELAHYRLAALPNDAPGGNDLHEYATDLLTVFTGFGFFGLSSAFNFSQHQDSASQGWQWSRRGYLGRRAWIFALAVFLAATGRSPDQLKSFLKQHLYSDLMKASRRVKQLEALPT